MRKLKSVHSDRLERFLGDQVHHISDAMRGFYGPKPIPVASIPGRGLYVTNDGDFIGHFEEGWEASLIERQYDKAKRFARKFLDASSRIRSGYAQMGFASLSDMISESTVANKNRDWTFYKVGTTGVASVTNSLWFATGQPTVGSTPSAAPGGNALDSTATGTWPFTNPTAGDTQHFVTAFVNSSVASHCLLLYDRLFHVLKTMSSTTTEAVSGVPTRYQNTTSGQVDSADNNFLFVEVQTALGATGHNWTVCTYTDQNGNTGATLPSLTGNASAIANRIDHPAGQWYAPLAAGDIGIKNLTQMQCSASVTGAVSFVIGHPLVFMPVPNTSTFALADGLNAGFNLPRIFDNACLSFLEVCKSATTASTYTGWFRTVAG